MTFGWGPVVIFPLFAMRTVLPQRWVISGCSRGVELLFGVVPVLCRNTP